MEDKTENIMDGDENLVGVWCNENDDKNDTPESNDATKKTNIADEPNDDTEKSNVNAEESNDSPEKSECDKTKSANSESSEILDNVRTKWGFGATVPIPQSTKEMLEIKQEIKLKLIKETLSKSTPIDTETTKNTNVSKSETNSEKKKYYKVRGCLVKSCIAKNLTKFNSVPLPVNFDIRKRWLKAMKWNYKWNIPVNARICLRHFPNEHFRGFKLGPMKRKKTST